MAVDKKISQLASGAPAQAGDEYVVARSGANYKLTLTNIAASMPATTITSGNLTFSSTAQRITGDMSNATVANRLMFQTSTTNGATQLRVIPNGTGTTGSIQAGNNNDPANQSVAALNVDSSEVRLASQINGTGSYLPMTFYTGGSERVRIGTDGRVAINTTSANSNTFLTVNGSIAVANPTRNAATSNQIGVWTSDDPADNTRANITFATTAGASSSNSYIAFSTNNYGVSGGERMRIDSSGNVGIGGTGFAFDKVAVTGTLPTDSNASLNYSARGTAPSGTTSQLSGFNSYPATAAASFTCAEVSHFNAANLTIGAGSTVTNQIGFKANNTLTGATNNYGFYSNIASGSNRWNFYAAGTAQNYFAGNTGVGSIAYSNTRLLARGSDTTSANYAFYGENSAAAALFYIRNDGLIYTGTSAESPYNKTTGAGANMVVDSAGLLFRSTSSLRYKSDVTDATHGLADVLKLRSVTYKGKNDGDKVFGGLIAEEVHDAGLTEFVAYDKEGRPDAIHYGNMVALLVKAVQELTARVAELEAK